MDRNLLSDVIEAEKEIQKQIEREKIRSQEWLEGIRKQCEADFAREELAADMSARLSLEQANEEAEIKASAILQRALLAAERLAALSDKDLSRIVAKHVRTILPE